MLAQRIVRHRSGRALQDEPRLAAARRRNGCRSILLGLVAREVVANGSTARAAAGDRLVFAVTDGAGRHRRGGYHRADPFRAFLAGQALVRGASEDQAAAGRLRRARRLSLRERPATARCSSTAWTSRRSRRLPALERLSKEFNVRRRDLSVCGLKDKQGRTEQLVGVNGGALGLSDVVQAGDLRLELIGRTAQPLSSGNITANRFEVTVRDLSAGRGGAGAGERRGGAARGHRQLLRLAALRFLEARPGLHRQAAAARRLRRRLEELSRDAQRARPAATTPR